MEDAKNSLDKSQESGQVILTASQKPSNRMVKLTNIKLSENEVEMLSHQMNGSGTFAGLLEDNFSCQTVENWHEFTGFSKIKYLV
jgi:hypothetical protein